MNSAEVSLAQLREIKKELSDTKNCVKELEDSVKIYELKYRINSVDRVLNYIRAYKKGLSDRDIDTLLCHCQNKLNGNIDGVELKLGRSETGDYE